MEVEIAGSRVAGRVRAPPSKSYTHRAILAAGYADGETTVRGALDSADTRATGAAVEAFGGTVAWGDAEDGRLARVTGFDGRPAVPDRVLDCGNSGTTMRLTTACAALADGLTVLTGDASLRSRPHGPLLEAIAGLGGRAESTRENGRAPLVIGGPIDGGRVAIPGDVSSQFVTALLMAGAVTDDGIAVELTTPLRSAPYVEITTELLDAFGVATSRTDAGYAVEGGAYRAGSYEVPADFSSGSYLLAAGAVAGDGGVTVEGLRPGPQGDSAIVDVLERMGAGIEWDRSAGRIDVVRGELAGVEVSVADTPDLLPTVAALGAAADGDTRIVDCEHVRHKETDRVSVMATELERMGAAVTEAHDVLTVHGDDSELVGATVDGHGDHRIVMALAVAALAASGPTTIRGAEHVDVSFPGFFEALAGLGVDVHGA
jgi:3-phosphoshikimate 1-carboxyvinyltransferase